MIRKNNRGGATISIKDNNKTHSLFSNVWETLSLGRKAALSRRDAPSADVLSTAVPTTVQSPMTVTVQSPMTTTVQSPIAATASAVDASSTSSIRASISASHSVSAGSSHVAVAQSQTASAGQNNGGGSVAIATGEQDGDETMMQMLELAPASVDLIKMSEPSVDKPRPSLPRNPRAWTPSMLRALFRNQQEIEIWRTYRDGVDACPENPCRLAMAAREELLNRHSKLLNNLAWTMFNRYRNMAEIGDFHTFSKLGACYAYDRYREDKAQSAEDSKAKLSTFVYRTSERQILSEVDASAYVHIPTQQRGMRAYFAGRYDNDPEKKSRFEIENGLTSDDAIAAAAKKFQLLNSGVSSLDQQVGQSGSMVVGDTLADLAQLSQDEMAAKLDLQTSLGRLNDRQRDIYNLYFHNDYSMQETAEKLSLTEGQVRGEIRSIRSLIRRSNTESASAA